MSKIVLEFEKLSDLHCGLGQVCWHLGKQMLKRNDRLYFYLPRDRFNLFSGHPFLIPVNKIHRKIPFTAPKADLWHCLHQDSPFFPRNRDAKIVLTIHDLNFLYEQKSESEKRHRLKSLQKKIDRADALTFVSNFTRGEVENNLNTEGKIKKVIHNGLALGEGKPMKPNFAPERKFLFAIGTVVAKKNFHTLIDFLDLNPEYEIVLGGWKDNNYAKEMELKILKQNLEKRFHLVGKLDEPEKKWLYQNCQAFLFPSLQEGFGLPVIEAMHYGKPVFLSRHTSLPEIGGELAFYFDNFKPEHMSDVFRKGMEIYNKDSDYPEKLRSYSSRFSWDKSAELYLNLYSELLAQK
jgi:glycosyltransferase involved in cell wall biosynthesis